jgi:pimeloyl-ACP methyl ester carboxylesterase
MRSRLLPLLMFLLVFALSSALGPSALASQTIDTARVRAAYAAATALRNEIERSHGRFVTVNGIKMHYLEWGDAKGVPLVWAHGSASSGYEIRAVAPRLVQAGYRVLAVDYRGHGLTRVTDYDFTIDHIADDLIGLLDSLRIPAAVFGGASKGGVVTAAVYDQYPNRVLGLLMADGGTSSTQWLYDHASPEQLRLLLSDPVPTITGSSELDVFRKVVGNIAPGALPLDWLLDMLFRIGPSDHGEWAFLPGFDRMMGSYEAWTTGMTRPTTLPPLQWSEQAMIPRMVFRNLHVPMMILDPQSERDFRPVTDQNERLARDHPDLVIHRIYAQSEHNILRSRSDWLVRDAVELLDQVRKRRR